MGKTNRTLIKLEDFHCSDIKIYQCIRGFKCEKCNQEYRKICKKTSKLVTQKCPECSSRLDILILGTTENYIQNITTVGQVIDSNTKRMGSYELQEKRIKELVRDNSIPEEKRLELGEKKFKEKQEIKAERENVKEIQKMTAEQKFRYIRTGEKP